MFGTGLRDDFITGAFWGDCLQNLLELPFRIYLQRLMRESLDILLRFIQHKSPDHLKTTVQIHRTDQSFERVCQNRGALASAARFFTTAHHQVSTETDIDGMNLQALA